MPLRIDTSNTMAQRDYESGHNKAPREFIGNYDLGVYMMVTGVPVLTKDTLPVFLLRLRLIQCNMGDAVGAVDPNVWEQFIGTTTNVSTLTDAAFFKTLRQNYGDHVNRYRHQWSKRQPGTLSTTLGKDDI